MVAGIRNLPHSSKGHQSWILILVVTVKNDNGGVAHNRTVEESPFYLSRLNAKAANLDLLINTAEEFYVAILISVPTSISCAVRSCQTAIDAQLHEAIPVE
jgi:mevalonate pyrophosphate decarboxylase